MLPKTKGVVLHGNEGHHYLKDKEQYPIKEWEEAVSYLLGCTVRFASYEEITNSLKPFSLGLE